MMNWRRWVSVFPGSLPVALWTTGNAAAADQVRFEKTVIDLVSGARSRTATSPELWAATN